MPKTKLLSQRPIAGVGNIYADEALWLASVNPNVTRLSEQREKSTSTRPEPLAWTGASGLSKPSTISIPLSGRTSNAMPPWTSSSRPEPRR